MPAASTLLSTVVMLQLPGLGMWSQFGTVAEVTLNLPLAWLFQYCAVPSAMACRLDWVAASGLDQYTGTNRSVCCPLANPPAAVLATVPAAVPAGAVPVVWVTDWTTALLSPREAAVTAAVAVIGCVVRRVTATLEPSATVDPAGAATTRPATSSWVMKVSGAFG